MAKNAHYKDFAVSLCGFNQKVEFYEAPWNTVLPALAANSEPGSDMRTISIRPGLIPGFPYGEMETSARVSNNVIKALHALRNGKHYVAFNEAEKTVFIEYHTTNPKAEGGVIAIIYNYEKRDIAGSLVMLHKTTGEPLKALPVGASKGTDKVLAKAAITMAVLTGEYLAGLDSSTSASSGAPAGWYVKENILLDFLMEHDTASEETDAATQQATALLSQAMFFAISNTKGFIPAIGNFGEIEDDSGNISKVLSLETIDSLSSNLVSFESAVDGKWSKLGLLKEPVLVPYASNNTEAARAAAASAGNSLSQLRESVKLAIHELTEDEKRMVPVMGDNYVVDAALANIAREIAADWHRPNLELAPNIILEGDAGSGKTAGSRFLADVWGIPYTKVTMNPMYESADLIGAFYPYLPESDSWDATDDEIVLIDQIRKQFGDEKPASNMAAYLREALSMESVRNLIREHYNIPDDSEVQYLTESAWVKMGKKKEDLPDVPEVAMEAHRLFEDKAYHLINMACILEQKEATGSVKYKFIESEILKAFRNGWLLEVQEAASVLRPGVLTQLNSLLESKGRIELPNGKMVYRHPDTIVVFTTNAGYAGNADVNESLRDRCTVGLKMDLPSAEVMAERAIAQTGFNNYSVVFEAAKAIEAIAAEAKAKNIRGSFGMRSLLAWCCSLQRGDYSEATFLNRVIYKMTTRDDDVQLLLQTYRANCSFASNVKKGKEKRV